LVKQQWLFILNSYKKKRGKKRNEEPKKHEKHFYTKFDEVDGCGEV
jgi:hypothetical protein